MLVMQNIRKDEDPGRMNETDLSRLGTEQSNPRSAGIDRLDTAGIPLINAEDQLVAGAVGAILPDITEAVDRIHQRMLTGGRLIYIGSGTSGRLGVLDAAECPPTYGTDPGEIMAIMAGGRGAVFRAVEGAEDDREQGRRDLAAVGLKPADSVLGIAASGRTPYVIGALEYANEIGALTISLSTVADAKIGRLAKVALAAVTGPEVVTGSTRMKSGTAQKLILNMLSTTLMIKRGKVYGNYMVDLRATNEKLRKRAQRTVMAITGVTEAEAWRLLEAADLHVKTAVAMHWLDSTATEARRRLAAVDGQLHRLAPDSIKGEPV